MSAIYTFPNQKKGDTFNGQSFTITRNAVAVVLTGATIRLWFREGGITGKIAKKLSNGDGITISTLVTNEFSVDEQIFDMKAGIYYYDIEIELVTGEIKTWIEGTLTLEQDVTTE
jgi:hypothetical protein